MSAFLIRMFIWFIVTFIVVVAYLDLKNGGKK
jgi:hypothetical protein